MSVSEIQMAISRLPAHEGVEKPRRRVWFWIGIYAKYDRRLR